MAAEHDRTLCLWASVRMLIAAAEVLPGAAGAVDAYLAAEAMEVVQRVQQQRE